MNRIIALIFAAYTLLLAGCCTTPQEHAATKWEYKHAYRIESVNKLADDGWVVIGFSAYQYSTTTGNPETWYLLKRAKQ